MKVINVRLADPDARTVILWERNVAHPSGEVFLAGPGVFEVALTHSVEARLRKGTLVVVTDEEDPKIEESPDSVTTPLAFLDAESAYKNLTDLPGLGKKSAEALGEAGIYEVADLAAIDDSDHVEQIVIDSGLSYDKLLGWIDEAGA